MNTRIKEMVRVATTRLGGEQSGGGGASSSGLGRRESTTRLGGAGTSFRRQPQPMAPTVRTVYCNDREANAPVGYKEKVHTFGILGCVLCVVGSITIVLHAPQELDIDSVKEVWDLATEPGFLCYAAIVVAAALVLIYFVVPHHGQTNIMVYIGVRSLLGSLTVMSVRALGIALKLTFSGTNQLFYPQTWAFALIVATCICLALLNFWKTPVVFMTLENLQMLI